MNNQARNKTLINLTWLIVIVNILLATLKIGAGLISNSQVLITDSVHTVSDIILSLIVIIGIKLSTKSSNFENISTIIISILLMAISAELIFDSTTTIISFLKNQEQEIESPTWIPITVSIIAIVSKEILFRISIYYGKRCHSEGVIVNAWHQRLDALASIISLLVLTLSAILINYEVNWVILIEPIGVILIVVLILHEVFDAFKDAFVHLRHK